MALHPSPMGKKCHCIKEIGPQFSFLHAPSLSLSLYISPLFLTAVEPHASPAEVEESGGGYKALVWGEG